MASPLRKGKELWAKIPQKRSQKTFPCSRFYHERENFTNVQGHIPMVKIIHHAFQTNVSKFQLYQERINQYSQRFQFIHANFTVHHSRYVITAGDQFQKEKKIKMRKKRWGKNQFHRGKGGASVNRCQAKKFQGEKTNVKQPITNKSHVSISTQFQQFHSSGIHKAENKKSKKPFIQHEKNKNFKKMFHPPKKKGEGEEKREKEKNPVLQNRNVQRIKKKQHNVARERSGFDKKKEKRKGENFTDRHKTITQINHISKIQVHKISRIRIST